MKERADKIWFLAAAIALLALSSIPNWAGYAAQNDEMRFRGIYFDQSDYAVHISTMRAAELGAWQNQLRFTNESHPAAFLRMFYILLGHIGAWLHLDAELTFQIARWLLGISALYFIYRLCLKIFPNEKNYARAAFLLAVLGSGLGWLQLILGAPLEPVSPIDFWLIDAYLFFSLSLFPSFAYTLTLMSAALVIFLKYLEDPKTSRLVWICVLAVACQITNPIAFAVIDLAFVGAVIFQRLEEKRVNKRNMYALAVIASAQAPMLAYNFLILTRDPIWRQFTLQNQTLSPPPQFYFWGFAPFWIFAVIGITRAIRLRGKIHGALLGWVLGGFALAYLPVAIQRRFLLGITIPLAILAVIGLREFLERMSPNIPRKKNKILLAYVSIASISTLYLILGLSMHLQSLPPKAFYPREMENAIRWLDEHAQPNDIVLSNPQSGEIIAQRAHLRVYIGHKMETIHYEEKKQAVTDFFKGEAKPDWLTSTSARWIFLGPYEKEIGANIKDGKIVYQLNGIVIYEVSTK
jgi:hypothetical protein